MKGTVEKGFLVGFIPRKFVSSTLTFASYVFDNTSYALPVFNGI